MKPACRCPATWNGINPPPCPRHNPPAKTTALKDRIKFLAILALIVLPGCASTLRLPGQRDPMVEVVRILAEAIKDQKVPPTPTPTPSPSPEGGR